MELTVWGCRGSLPTPGLNTVVYGGHTTCFEVRNDRGESLILDAGTGIKELGHTLLTGPPVDSHLLISHTHWDHIMGYPFFAPLFIRGNRMRVLGPPHFNHSFEEVMHRQMEFSYFPVRMQELQADLTFTDLHEGRYEFGGFRVTTRPMNHPVFCLGFRIESDGQTIVYGGDHEPYYENVYLGRRPANDRERIEKSNLESFVDEQNVAVIEFMRDADLLVMDGTYTADEYHQKVGWGHGSMQSCIETALTANAQRLIITHHEPTRTDEQLEELASGLRREIHERGEQLEIDFAREGTTVMPSDTAATKRQAITSASRN